MRFESLYQDFETISALDAKSAKSLTRGGQGVRIVRGRKIYFFVDLVLTGDFARHERQTFNPFLVDFAWKDASSKHSVKTDVTV